MLIITGESACGKSTVEKKLSQFFGFNKLVSYTTRQIRENEVDGVDYHFITVEKFEKLKDEGFFAEYATYNGWNYGTAKADCTDDKVLVATPHGLRQLKNNKDLNIVSFYINVPRRDRLIKILQRGDSIEESYRRNLSDVGMFDGIADEVDFVIHNDEYQTTSYDLANEIKEKYFGVINGKR